MEPVFFLQPVRMSSDRHIGDNGHTEMSFERTFPLVEFHASLEIFVTIALIQRSTWRAIENKKKKNNRF